MKNIAFLTLIGLSLFVFTSCNEDSASDEKLEVLATYVGEFTKASSISIQGTCDILKDDGTIIKMHIYSNDATNKFDTCFVMNQFGNGICTELCLRRDSLGNCDGDGNGDGLGKKNRKGNRNRWQQHLADDDVEGEIHCGQMNRGENTMKCNFLIGVGEARCNYTFEGKKQ
jgi:hypothetical protein